MLDLATRIENIRLKKNPISFSFESKTDENLSLTYLRMTADSAYLTINDKISGKAQKLTLDRENFVYVEDAYALEKKGSETMFSDWLGVLADYYFGQKITQSELKAKTYKFQNNVFEVGKYTYSIGRSGHFWDKRWNHYEMLFKNNKPTLVISEIDGNNNPFEEKSAAICLNKSFYALSDWEASQISSLEVRGHPKKQIDVINDILENKRRVKELETIQMRKMMNSKTH